MVTNRFATANSSFGYRAVLNLESEVPIVLYLRYCGAYVCRRDPSDHRDIMVFLRGDLMVFLRGDLMVSLRVADESHVLHGRALYKPITSVQNNTYLESKV